ncbi:MAG: putative two-component system response regulator LuxR [Acidimicrobiia bacterium]|nr:MAG: putative two-component system response regulator LuxR [Acidimicrobiia bacterium]
MIRLVLADDQPLVRTGLRRIFDRRHGFEVVGEAGDGEGAVEAAVRLRPDVVVMDMRMPRTDGAEAIRRLRRLPDAPPVLVLTTYDDPDTVRRAVGAGAAGFALKDAGTDDLHRAVREVAAGNGWVDFGVARPLLEHVGRALPAADRRADLDRLTDRERHVLALVGAGASNAEIAQRCCISTGTVKTHVGSILAKLGLRDRAAAIVFAFRHGLVSPGDPVDGP